MAPTLATFGASRRSRDAPLSKELRLARVADRPAVHAREVAQEVGLRPRRRTDVPHGLLARDERIRDQGAVALHPVRLGAHDRDALRAAQVEQVLERGVEFRGLHVVGVGAEGGVAPAAIDGVRPRTTQATEAGEMDVAEAGLAERGRQRRRVEVRMTPGPRDLSDVGDERDAVRAHQLRQLGECPRRMAHGPHASAYRPARAARRRFSCRISPVQSLPEQFNAATFFVDRHLTEGRGRRTAFRFAGRSVTYADVAESVDRCGNALAALGVEVEHRVLLALNDTPAFPAAFWATA